ncbi:MULTISPECIES: 50S ribosomal protein L29 [Thermus]|jgi:large subunit ribosomal protein L29|uniref:Large ribosomal subunit protein uL29 n=1 Tax=Thermus brockianus TaxID=56956 RepID=A0A1J0LTL9_THEBO|nr:MULTISPECIES: 50S ribosomal protein L29 [Thermus]APD09576.1 50S ribosomal protein L29 [Thermus brockianus]KHG65352.1 50S ribosomal protein L29 [Thermus sp. 2.9]
MKLSEVKKELEEARKLSPAELEKLIRKKKQELMELRFQASIGQLSQNHRIRETRKSIARLLTVLNEKRRANA